MITFLFFLVWHASALRFDAEEKKLENITISTGIPKYDAAYVLALNEAAQNLVNGEYHAGQGWGSVWVRDTSYSMIALLDKKAAEQSLQNSVDRRGMYWKQDACGHFGAWPHLTDAIVGAHGAWSLYLIHGDKEFLSWAHNVTKNSLTRAEKDVYDNETGLFKGCASFMESNGAYPKEYHYDGSKIAQTKAMSTNMLYYIGYKVSALMGQELGSNEKEIHTFEEKATNLRQAIRSQFWSKEKGYYAYFKDENNTLNDRMEGLGESLALLAPEFESDNSRIDSIFANTHRTDHGIPCLWPPFGNTGKQFWDAYHDGRVWPFVQGYWALAAARHGKVDVFAEEMEKLVELSKVQNTFAEYYNSDLSFEKGHGRQLWSAAGFLGMVNQGLFGMNFQPNSLKFSPIKPHGMAQTTSLKNLSYRDMKLDLYVEGFGSQIKSFKIDGKAQEEPIVNANLKGSHIVEIILTE